MRNIIWTAVLAVVLGVAGVVVAAVERNYSVVALCLSALGITFSSLSNREGQ